MAGRPTLDGPERHRHGDGRGAVETSPQNSTRHHRQRPVAELAQEATHEDLIDSGRCPHGERSPQTSGTSPVSVETQRATGTTGCCSAERTPRRANGLDRRHFFDPGLDVDAGMNESDSASVGHKDMEHDGEGAANILPVTFRGPATCRCSSPWRSPTSPRHGFARTCYLMSKEKPEPG